MDQRLAPALSELHRLLTHCAHQLQLDLRFALLGGLAVSTWGVIRATQDIDFIADCDPSPIRDVPLRSKLNSCLEGQGSSLEWRVGAGDDPIPLLLRVKLSAKFHGVTADVLWAHKKWQREALQRPIDVDIDGEQIPVLHPEDLILMKLDAGGPQDLLDVQRLLADPPPQLHIDQLKKSAARQRFAQLLNRCLANAKHKK